MADEHEGSGRDRATSPETFLEAIRDLDGTAYTDEIADHVDCHKRTADRGLQSLEDDKQVTSRETDEGTLWILPEVGDI